jgi:hypothetical protein
VILSHNTKRDVNGQLQDVTCFSSHLSVIDAICGTQMIHLYPLAAQTAWNPVRAGNSGSEAHRDVVSCAWYYRLSALHVEL